MDTTTLAFQNTVRSLSDLTGKVRGGQGRMAWETELKTGEASSESGGFMSLAMSLASSLNVMQSHWRT